MTEQLLIKKMKDVDVLLTREEEDLLEISLKNEKDGKLFFLKDVENARNKTR